MTNHDNDWQTWTAERPAELTHSPTGIKLTPVLYSDRAQRATDLPPGEQVAYGHRGMRDGRISFDSRFEDTHMAWSCNRDADGLELSWSCKAHGEWGLRYWVCLCAGGPADLSVRYDPDSGAAILEVEHHRLSIRFSSKPLLVTAHEDVNDLIDEFLHSGYFYLGSRSCSGSFLAFRFNLDETPELSVTVSSGLTDSAGAFITQPIAPAASDSSVVQQALQAMHDVLAWNHVFDPVNQRPYTALTRNWSRKKFGGFGVWLNDNLFHALMWGMLDPEKSRHNMNAVFEHQTAAGNFPCLITGNDAWLDRSQIPIASYVVWAIYRASNDLDFLGRAYPKILANHQWWWKERKLQNIGLVAYGTSADVGDGLYKGTRLGARNESAMDNMAVHDEAVFNPDSGLLQSADVGLNSLLALDGEMLVLMAQELGLQCDAAELMNETEQHKQRIQTWLWDSSRAVFANRLCNGKFVDALAPTSFFPMAAGIATEDQAACLVQQYLRPEEKFGGKYALPSAPRDQPAFADNSYWRGRVWGPLNYWVYQGLMRYRYKDDAQKLASNSLKLFNQHWRDRKCGENYSAVTGEIHDQPDTDSFYTWGALLPALSVLQTVAETHWDGLMINVDPAISEFGPTLCHLGEVEIRSSPKTWTVSIDGKPWLVGSGAITFNSVEFDGRTFRSVVSTGEKPVSLRFPRSDTQSARMNGQPLEVDQGSFSLSNAVDNRLLEVAFNCVPPESV